MAKIKTRVFCGAELDRMVANRRPHVDKTPTDVKTEKKLLAEKSLPEFNCKPGWNRRVIFPYRKSLWQCIKGWFKWLR